MADTFKVRDKETGEVFTVREKSSAPDAKSLVDQAGPTSISERLLSTSVAGLPAGVAGVKNIEDALPATLGTLGAVGGAQVGHPHLGLGFGTAGGKLLQDSIKKLQGEGKDIDVGDAVILGGLAAAGGKAVDVAFKSVGVAFNTIPERARKALFDKALQGVKIGWKVAKRNWRRSVTALENSKPGEFVNLRPTMVRINRMFAQLGDDTLIPQLKTAVSRNPKLSKVVDDPGKAVNLTLKEAQELKNAITSTTNTITKKAVKGKNTPNERVVFDMIDEIDDAITAKFPEMTNIRATYAKAKSDFDLALPLVQPGTAVESSIFSTPKGILGLGGSKFMGSTGGKLAFQDITSTFKGGQKLLQTTKLAHDLNRGADALGRMAQLTFGGAILRKLAGGGRSSDTPQGSGGG